MVFQQRLLPDSPWPLREFPKRRSLQNKGCFLNAVHFGLLCISDTSTQSVSLGAQKQKRLFIRGLFAHGAVFPGVGDCFNLDWGAFGDYEFAFTISDQLSVISQSPIEGVAQRGPGIGIRRGCPEGEVVLRQEPEFVGITCR